MIRKPAIASGTAAPCFHSIHSSVRRQQVATTITADLLFILSAVELHIRDRFKLCPRPRLASRGNRQLAGKASTANDTTRRHTVGPVQIIMRDPCLVSTQRWFGVKQKRLEHLRGRVLQKVRHPRRCSSLVRSKCLGGTNCRTKAHDVRRLFLKLMETKHYADPLFTDQHQKSNNLPVFRALFVTPDSSGAA